MINHEDLEKSPLIGKTVDVEDEGRGSIISHEGDYVSIQIPSDDYLGIGPRLVVAHVATLELNEDVL